MTQTVIPLHPRLHPARSRALDAALEASMTAPLHWPAFREWLDAETEDAARDTPLYVVLNSFRQFCERTGRQQPTNRTELLALLSYAGIQTESYRAEGRTGVLWRVLDLRVTSAPQRGRRER